MIDKISFNENEFKYGFETSKVGGGDPLQKGDIEGAGWQGFWNDTAKPFWYVIVFTTLIWKKNTRGAEIDIDLIN